MEKHIIFIYLVVFSFLNIKLYKNTVPYKSNILVHNIAHCFDFSFFFHHSETASGS